MIMTSESVVGTIRTNLIKLSENTIKTERNGELQTRVVSSFSLGNL